MTIGADNIEQVGCASVSGITFGGSTSEKISFYGVTPVAQRASSSQAAVVTTAVGSAEETTNWAWTTQTQPAALIALTNEIRNTLVAYGMIAGA